MNVVPLSAIIINGQNCAAVGGRPLNLSALGQYNYCF